MTAAQRLLPKRLIDLCQQPTRIPKEANVCQKLGMTFISLPMGAGGPTSDEITAFLRTVENCKQSHAIAFVHCAEGRDRTGCMVGIDRQVEDGWTLAQAHQEMLRYGFRSIFQQMNRIVTNYGQEALALPNGNSTQVKEGARSGRARTFYLADRRTGWGRG
jgi:hypothetical protein